MNTSFFEYVKIYLFLFALAIELLLLLLMTIFIYTGVTVYIKTCYNNRPVSQFCKSRIFNS